MEGLLNVLADSYIILIILSILLILAIIGYNSVKNDDFVIKNDMRSNNKPELEDLKKEVEGRNINDTVTSNTMKMNPLGNLPNLKQEVNNEVEKL